MKKKIAITVVSILVILILSGAYLVISRKSSQRSFPGAEQRQNPPAELSFACQGKNEGDSCEVSMPQRNNSERGNKISGTCKKAPSGNQLSCVPQGGPGGSRGQRMPGEPSEQAPVNMNTES